MLLSLDPAHDPLGTLLCFDYYCLRSIVAGPGEPANLLLPFVAGFSHQPLLLLPPYAYSAALALQLEADGTTVPEPAAAVSLAGLTSMLDIEPLALLQPADGSTIRSAAGLMRRALALYPAVLPKLVEAWGGVRAARCSLVEG